MFYVMIDREVSRGEVKNEEIVSTISGQFQGMALRGFSIFYWEFSYLKFCKCCTKHGAVA